jgi:pathogenesis-related protein 1
MFNPVHRALRIVAALLVWISTGVLAPAHAADREPAAFTGMLETHNALRSAVGVAPLRWSDLAAQQAQGWAAQLVAQDCPLRYNPDPRRRELYGENIFKAWAQQPYTGFRRNATEVARRWSEEAAFYDHRSHTCNAPAGRQCGQYLQMIWETTEVMGCAQARCRTAEVWVCNYTPRGGQENLKPYGNPPPSPPTEVVVDEYSCSIRVADGVDPAAPDR